MTSTWHRRGAGAGVSLLLLAGCNASQTQNTTLLPTANTSATHSSRAGARSGAPDLLYVSDGKDGSVAMYVLGTGKLYARLSNLHPSGLCSDNNGTVVILNGSDATIYPHGRTQSLGVLREPSAAALQSCAADPTTGDIAVANTTGRITIYAGGKRNALELAGDGYASSIAYDGSGDLFLAKGRDLRILSRGTTHARDVQLSGVKPSRIDAILWDGRYLAVESIPQSATTTVSVSRYAVNGGRLSYVDSIALANRTGSAQFAVYAGKLITSASNGVAFYDYQEGGSPATILRDPLEPRYVTVSRAPAPKFAVTTYHYDNYRTGWDDSESALTYKTVNSSSFGQIATVSLDDQVDAQPLVVPDEMTTGGTSQGRHDVVFVATENDSVYAIDASSGKILIKQSLGAPVQTPLGCNNNGPNVGIDSTPVVDLANNVMYVVTYTNEGSVPTYRIHELSLSNLADVVPSVVVSASHELTNDQSFAFNATYQRQRPALLEANGNIYAGFGSFCDFAGSLSRGWLLGWQTGTLTPLAANRLTNSLATSPDDFFLSSIWMAGYGPAADPSGNVYFVTGNSDYSGTTYNGVTNVNESVVKLSSDLTTMLSIFTPSDVAHLDEVDGDFGSGGVLLVPALSSSATPLATAAGKDGRMYLMDQNNLGGFGGRAGANKVLATAEIGGCWCGESYYSDRGLQRIVSSGGNTVMVWDVTGGHKTKLKLAETSPGLPDGQDPGFFTSVSSDRSGRHAIIWALARPSYVPGPMSLYAFAAKKTSNSGQMKTLYENSSAGYWASTGGDADLVPVVANGKVYVASYQQLSIFGLTTSKNARGLHHGAVLVSRVGGPNEVTGVLVSRNGSLLTLRTRTGSNVAVDGSVAMRSQRASDLVMGEPFSAMGRYDSKHVFHARLVVRAKPSPATWPPDR